MPTPEYRYLFGPVPSRRFGRSLGIDLTPLKTCSLDCIFCQLGRTTTKTVDRRPYVAVDDVIDELQCWLDAGGEADYLTLSGSGEPTLHTGFGQLLAFLRRTPIPSALLTNGTLFSMPDVREAAGLADVVKISLSAWDQRSFEWVNRPHPRIDFNHMVDGLKRFRTGFQGRLWLEVFLLSGVNAMAGSVAKIARLSKTVRPDRVHLNTVVRPPAEDFAAAVPMAELKALGQLFEPPADVAIASNIRPSTAFTANAATILAMLRRRPCTNQQIQTAFGLHINEVSKILGHLIRGNQIRTDLKNDKIYYRSIRERRGP